MSLCPQWSPPLASVLIRMPGLLLCPNQLATVAASSSISYSVPAASPAGLAIYSEPMGSVSTSVPTTPQPLVPPAQAVVTPPLPSAASAFQHDSPAPASCRLLVPSTQAAFAAATA